MHVYYKNERVPVSVSMMIKLGFVYSENIDSNQMVELQTFKLCELRRKCLAGLREAKKRGLPSQDHDYLDIVKQIDICIRRNGFDPNKDYPQNN